MTSLPALALALCLGLSAGGAQNPQTAPVVPARPVAEPLKMVRISGGVMAGQLISKVNPIYPDTDAEGFVVLHVIVRADGIVDQANAISGPQVLREPAEQAVRQWVYRPYLLNGEAVVVDTTVNVVFRHTPPHGEPG